MRRGFNEFGDDSRRAFQFGLRTLLLLVTMVGMMLGWFGWRLHEQRQAIRQATQQAERARELAANARAALLP